MFKQRMICIVALLMAVVLEIGCMGACSRPKESVNASSSSSATLSTGPAQSSSPESESVSPSSENPTYSTVDVDDITLEIVANSEGGLDFDLFKEERSAYLNQVLMLNLSVGCDNETPLEELLKKNEKKVDIPTTFAWTCVIENYHWNNGPEYAENNISVPWLEFAAGIRPAFSRSMGSFYDEERQEEAERMYTVFESELGGRIYCFYFFYPQSYFTLLRTYFYQPTAVDREDVQNIRAGDSIWDIMDNSPKLKPFLLYHAKRIQDDKIRDVHRNFILLSDQSIWMLLFDEDGTVLESTELEDNTFKVKFDTKADDVVGDENSPWHTYDMTILPQDYPPAS